MRAGLKLSALHITQRSTTCRRRQGPARPGTETNRETTSLRQTHLRLTLKPPLVKHLPLKPQLVQRTPQLRIRVRLGVGAARILPPPVTPPIFRPVIWGSPILQPKDQQLRRSQHRRGRFPVHRHHGTHSHDPRFTCTSPRSTSSMSPSSESGWASTHACRATCQRRNAGNQDPSSPGAAHSSRRNPEHRGEGESGTGQYWSVTRENQRRCFLTHTCLQQSTQRSGIKRFGHR